MLLARGIINALAQIVPLQGTQAPLMKPAEPASHNPSLSLKQEEIKGNRLT